MSWRSVLALLVALVASWSFVCETAQAQTSTVGRWDLGPVWDIAPVHMMLTPSGKVIFWPGDYISGDDPRLWDPVTSTLTSLPKAGYDLFCVGHAFLGDGTLFVAGGNLQTPYNGLPNASIFNPFTNVWTRLPDMNAARWYPTTTFTGTGEVLVMTGDIDSVQLENPLPQVWQPSTGTWRDLTNAVRKIYNYSWVYWTPFGNAIVVGPRQTHGVGYDFIRRLKNDPTALRILGDGTQKKSYIHVDDVLEAIFFVAAKSLKSYEVFNVATNDYVTVRQIADWAVAIAGLQPGEVRYDFTGGDRGWKGDVPVVRFDCSKIKALGWTNRRSSAEALTDAMKAMRKEIESA